MAYKAPFTTICGHRLSSLQSWLPCSAAIGIHLSLSLNLSTMAPVNVNGCEARGSRGDRVPAWGVKRGPAIVQSEILNWNGPAVSVRRRFWLRHFKNKIQPKHRWNQRNGVSSRTTALQHNLNRVCMWCQTYLISPGMKLNLQRREMNSKRYYSHMFSLWEPWSLFKLEGFAKVIRERVGPALTSPCRGWLWNSWTLSYVNMHPKCCADLTTDSRIHFVLKFCLYAHSRRECLSPSVRPPGRSSKPLLCIFCLISLGRGGEATGTTTVSRGGIRSPGEVIRWAIK